jgi:Kdo2-lipid IVA lauroyltransferase/acyltransferase
MPALPLARAALRLGDVAAGHRPLAGYDRRVRDNLELVLPDLPAAEVRRLMRAVPDNVGARDRDLFGRRIHRPARRHPDHRRRPGGPGCRPCRGRPVVLVTGHFGNYDASRAALIARGYPGGGAVSPDANPYFNRHYVARDQASARRSFPRGKRGLAGMVRFLRGGGMLGLLIDQHMSHGARWFLRADGDDGAVGGGTGVEI